MIGRVALLALALTGAKDDPLAGRVAGPPVECIDLGQVSTAEIAGPATILYRDTPRRLWRTAPEGACTPLRWYDTLVVEVQGRQLCHRDVFRVRSASGPILSAYCRMGRFTPYDLPRR